MDDFLYSSIEIHVISWSALPLWISNGCWTVNSYDFIDNGSLWPTFPTWHCFVKIAPLASLKLRFAGRKSMSVVMRKNNPTIHFVAPITPHRLNPKHTWVMNPLASNLWWGFLGHNKKPLKVLSYQPWTIVFWWLFLVLNKKSMIWPSIQVAIFQ